MRCSGCVAFIGGRKDGNTQSVERWAGRLGFDFRHEQGFLSSVTSRPSLGPLSLLSNAGEGMKLSGRGVDRSSSSAEVKNGGTMYLDSPIYLYGIVLNYNFIEGGGRGW
jgi:hypothetical protein